MNLKKMISSWEGATKVAAAMAFTNVLLAIGLLMAVSALSNKHERIVLTPPGLSKQVAVDWLKADVDYMKSFAMYFGGLMTNVTPKNAQLVADTLSSMVAPAIYPDVRKQILSFSKNPAHLSSGGAVTFDAIEIIAEEATSKFFVIGDYTVHSSTNRERTQQVLELVIKMVDGRPQVQAADFYPGNTPRTAEWIANNAERLAAERAEAASAAQKD